MSTKSSHVVVVAFALIMTAQFARAQSTTSGLSGRVIDSTGAIAAVIWGITLRSRRIHNRYEHGYRSEP